MVKPMENGLPDLKSSFLDFLDFSGIKPKLMLSFISTLLHDKYT